MPGVRIFDALRRVKAGDRLSCLALRRLLFRLLERDVVVEDCPWIYGHLLWIVEGKLDERDLVLPDLFQELLDELHREVLSSAAAIAESEGSIASRVAYRMRRAVDYAVYGAERTVGHLHVAPVLDGEGRLREGTPR